MKKLDEKKIVELFQSKFGNAKFISEDVEFFTLGENKIVCNVDTLVESADIPTGLGQDLAARKSIVSCVSDFAAKGARPKFGIISITIPKTYTKKEISKLANGLAKAADEFGIKMLGGDTSQGKELSISVFLIGNADQITKRNGAKTGDIICTSGFFGYASAGLKIILEKKQASGTFERKAKNAVLRPNARLELGCAIKKYITACMDSSDGLSGTLNEMARQSKKKFCIHTVPAKKDVSEFATRNKIEPFGLIFDGGEEFELIFTVPKRYYQKVLETSKRLKVPLVEIGQVAAGKGVTFESEKKSFVIKDRRWLH